MFGWVGAEHARMLASPAVRGVLYAAAFLGFVAALFGIRIESQSVPHQLVWIDATSASKSDSGAVIPAVLYGVEPFARESEDEPPPVVVLVHGFACNKSTLANLARRLARGGYAVLAPDLRGHGQNRASLNLDHASTALRDDIEAAVTFAAGHPLLDSRRIALIGHSMGASAVLDYAGHHPDVGAVVSISGAPVLPAPYGPPNPLLLWGSGDPDLLRAGARWQATQYAELEQIVLGRTYGDFERGSAVRAVEVDNVGHVSILFSDGAAEQILDWLDRTLGPGERSPARTDRAILWSLLGMIAGLILVGGLGRRLAPVIPEVALPEIRITRSLLFVLAAMLVACLVWVSVDPFGGSGPFGFVGLVGAQELVGPLALGGAILWLIGWPQRSLRRDGLLSLRTGLAVLLLWLGVYVIFGAAAQGYQEIWLSSARVLPALLVAVLTAPLFVALEWMLRRPGKWGWLPALAGKCVLLVVLIAAGASGAMSMFVWFGVIALATLILPFELVCWQLYRSAANPWVTGLLQAGWLGSWVASLFPLG